MGLRSTPTNFSSNVEHAPRVHPANLRSEEKAVALNPFGIESINKEHLTSALKNSYLTVKHWE
jgi:hypothetical protein